jgi:glycerol-3-phosphate cytidylyltransferase
MTNKMKKGFTCGIFDLFHAGHVLMLKECKDNCDYLIVAVNSGENISNEINKNKNVPIFTIEERVSILKSCKYVDEVVVYSSEEELIRILEIKSIDIRFLGDDYKGKKITESDKKIQLYFINRNHGKSTSGYIKQILMRYKNV